MKLFYLYLVIFIFSYSSTQGQAIRKNYLEMTSSEKIDLVNAFYELRNGPDLINDLSLFHGNFFSFENTLDPDGLSIHLNLPDRPENDIFFAWHRRQMFEVEQAMQDINPNLSMPYWDSSIDQAVDSPLWEVNFMGQFDQDWNLNRNFENRDVSLLPTPEEVVSVQSIGNYLDYSNIMERGTPHVGAHQWVAGVMSTPFSPRDPVFYLHHTNVDRLWEQWEEINQSSSFQQTSMLRYNGTYSFNGSVIPSVDPNSITSNKVYGIFYAENGLVDMSDYTVSNTYRALENFYYQFTIEAGNNFIIPSDGNCKFESLNQIILKPGFHADSGSEFIAKIDNALLSKSSISKRTNEIVRNQIPFPDVKLEDVYENFGMKLENVFVSEIYPNPFNSELNIGFNGNLDLEHEILLYDLMGRLVYYRSIKDSNKIRISNLEVLDKGIYLLHIMDVNKNILLSQKVIKF